MTQTDLKLAVRLLNHLICSQNSISDNLVSPDFLLIKNLNNYVLIIVKRHRERIIPLWRFPAILPHLRLHNSVAMRDFDIRVHLAEHLGVSGQLRIQRSYCQAHIYNF